MTGSHTPGELVSSYQGPPTPQLRRDNRHFVGTWIDGLRNRRRFSGAETYVMFVGYPRSGHTLVGAQMTAHKNMVISNELHALKYVQLGYRRDQLLEMIYQKDRQFVSFDCQDGNYKHQVPNQWQGKYQKLTVIGDKKGAGSSQALLRKPELLDRLKRTVKLPVRMIHVVRNPYDTISRIKLVSGRELSWSINRFFKMCCGTAATLKANPHDVLTLRHEDYVANPKDQLARICRFVGVETTPEYLDDCASVVNRSPRLARSELNWTPELVQHVQQMIQKHEFLAGYHFEQQPAQVRYAA